MHIQVFAGLDDIPMQLGEFFVTRTKSRRKRKPKVEDTKNSYKFQFVPAGPSGSVRKTRQAFLDKIYTRGKLKPSHSVLEIGPGIGRFALPITQFLQPYGCFKGLEILPQAVKYCNYHIGSRFKNFNMFLVDINNQMYNESGQLTAAEYRFPFEDSEFDLVYLQSVFTHMMFPGVANYIAEISRVLKPGGHCVATYFVLNDETHQLITEGKATQTFLIKEGDSYTNVKEKPETAVAFEEPLVVSTHAKYNLKVVDPIDYGFWRGIKARVPQDVVVARKPS